MVTLTSKLFKTAIALLVAGVAILVILQVIYIPKVEAYQHAALNYSRNWPSNNQTKPPMPIDYGLDSNAIILIGVLDTAGVILVFVGAAYLVVLLVAKLVKRVRGYDEANSSSETPDASAVKG
jgi:hypothetical protein